MTLRSNTNGATADGSPINEAASAAGGTQYTFVGGTDPVSDDAQAYTPGGFTTSALMPAATSGYFRWDGFDTAVLRGQMYFRLGALPGATDHVLLQWRGSGGSVTHASIEIEDSTGNLNMLNGSYSNLHTLTAVEISKWYRIAWLLSIGAGSTDIFHAAIYDVDAADTNTALAEEQLTGISLADVNIDRQMMGASIDSNHGNYWVQTVQAEDDISGGLMAGLYVPDSSIWGLLDGLGGSTPMQLGIIT